MGHVIAWQILLPHTITTHCAALSNSQIYWSILNQIICSWVCFKGYLEGYKRPVFLRSLHLKNEKTGPVLQSFAVLVWSGYGLFLVLRLDFQTLEVTKIYLSTLDFQFALSHLPSVSMQARIHCSLKLRFVEQFAVFTKFFDRPHINS